MSRLMPAPSDARAFTNYLSRSLIEDSLQHTFRVRNETEYRRYLQTKPNAVIREMQALMYKRPVVNRWW